MTPEHEALAASVRAAIARATSDDDLWQRLVEIGCDELGIEDAVVVLEELGYALAPAPFLSNAAAGLMIQHAGSDEQRDRWLPGIASGEQRGTVAYVENGVASLVPDSPGLLT